jgi:hypothetical protein
MDKNDILNIVHAHYPNAMTTADTVDKMFDLLKARYDLEPSQIVHADSICADDVNSIEYPRRAFEMLGPFNMGGLDGFPFTGLTGMGAFAHHAPDCGAVFIYYAPHIGISKSGEIGEIHRVGQRQPSACCGAAKAALGKLLKGEIEPDRITELDYQQNTIEQIFHRQTDRITGAEIPLKAATDVMYEAIEQRIDLLVEKTQFPGRYLILMGGVLINGDRDVGAFNSCKRFEVTNLETGQTENLIELLDEQ